MPSASKIALLFGFLGACGDPAPAVVVLSDGGSDSRIDAPTDGQQEEGGSDAELGGPALVRFFQGDESLGAVDVYLNAGTTPTFANIGYLGGSTYVELPSGTTSVRVVAAGAALTEPALFEMSDLTIDAGRAHSCSLYPTDSDETALSLVVDDRSVIDSARIRIRPVHLARGGAIDFYQTRQVGNPIPLGTDLSPGGASQTASTLSAGSFEFGVALSGSVGAELMPDFAARFITPNLPSGTDANVYVVSYGSDLVLILHLADGSTQQVEPSPMVRLNLTHVGTDGQAVDLFIGTSSIFSGVGFAQSPAPTTQLPVGVYTLSVTLSGNGPENAFTSIADWGLNEGRWNAFVYRQAPPAGNNPGLALAAFPEDLAGAFGNTRLRMVHAAHTVAPIEVCLVNESLVQRLTQSAISLGAWTGADSAEDPSDDYIGLPSDTYQLGFDIRMNGESSVPCSAADLVFQLPPLPSKSVRTVFLMNDITGPLLIIQNTTGALSAAIRPIT